MRTLRVSAGRWDGVGIGLSGLCAVHCVLMPLVLALLPLWPIVETFAEWLHPVLALPVVLVTVAALQDGFRRHASTGVVLVLGLGMLLVLLAALGHDVLGATGEVAMTLAGSSLLLAGHWLNGHVCHTHC